MIRNVDRYLTSGAIYSSRCAGIFLTNLELIYRGDRISDHLSNRRCFDTDSGVMPSSLALLRLAPASIRTRTTTLWPF